jgi:hypothetical protein
MVKLPDTLTRKAVARTFDRISPVAWEKLFEREDQNGLGRLRREGDYPGRAYYETEGVMQWLLRNDHYTVEQIDEKANGRSVRALQVRTHLLAG